MMKVAVLGGDTDVFEKNPIETRPFGFNRDKFEVVKNPYDADWIYLNLHYLNCNQDFQAIQQTKEYQDNADRCVMWTMHDHPMCAYVDPRPLKFVCSPLGNPEDNKKMRVVPAPLQMRHFEYELIQDKEFIERCRNQKKIYDFVYIGQVQYAQRDWLRPENIKQEKYLFEETKPIYGISSVKERVEIVKKFCLDIAQARFAFSPRGAGSSSFRLFQSLMSGTVPVVSGMTDYPFSNVLDWNLFTIIDDDHTKTNSLVSMDESSLREKGMEVWDEYFDMRKTDEKFFEEILCQHPLKSS
jgi:hypothetical protein